jgi:hypothetical protein
LQGDLDWIVMKALEKDRNRRYETANGLAMDIQRYIVSGRKLLFFDVRGDVVGSGRPVSG